MTGILYTVGVLLSREDDRARVARFLREMGHIPVAPSNGALPLDELLTASMIIADENMMRSHGRELKPLRCAGGDRCTPILVVLSPNSDADFWLGYGADDVLLGPLSKLQLGSKIKLFGRLHEQSERPGEVAERKKGDEDLRESEARLRRAVLNAPFPIMIFNEDWLVLLINEVWTELTGYRHEDIPTIEAWTEKAHGEKKEWARKHIAGLADINVRTRGIEITITTSDGDERVWNISTAPLGVEPDGKKIFASMAMDVTERKRAQADRERLANIVEQAVEGILILDRDGAIRYANPAFLRLSGNSEEELAGRSIRSVFSRQFSETDFAEIIEKLNHGLHWSGHIAARKKDEKEFMAEAIAFPLRNGKHIEGFGWILRDTTHELQMERQLRQAQKLEAIGTLAGGIAHDFNNMLTAILGYSELMLDEASEGSPFRDELQEILKAGKRARELVQQILSFSRQEEQVKEPVQVSSIVKETCKFLRASLPSTIEIRQNVASFTDMVLADPTQIHQMIMNLCTNAAHAMKENGGVLEILLDTVEIKPGESSFYFNAEPGAYTRLVVRDTGHGMTPDIVERIFDPFFSTKKQGEGTGLGLSIVHGIVKSHGGQISVSSEPGQGSVFEVLLPRIESAPMGKDAEVLPLPQGKERILVVDDEEMIVAMTQRMLQRLGYVVECHAGSVKALEAFRADPDRFDLVITDKTMPELTGEKMAREMISLRPDIPIILCTGYNDLAEEDYVGYGVRMMLKKPLQMQVLAETIRSLLNGPGQCPLVG